MLTLLRTGKTVGAARATSEEPGSEFSLTEKRAVVENEERKSKYEGVNSLALPWPRHSTVARNQVLRVTGRITYRESDIR
jgi:hypothetical protein